MAARWKGTEGTQPPLKQCDEKVWNSPIPVALLETEHAYGNAVGTYLRSA